MLHFSKITLAYYVAENGKAPFIEWLEGIPDRAVGGKIKVRLDRLMRGLFGDTKSVGSGVEELRIHHGPGYRVYYGRMESMIVLLGGGTKGHQQKDIDRAKVSWSNFLETSHGKGKTNKKR